MPYTKTKDNRLVNEVTLGDGYPLSNDLQPLKIGGEASILGISSPLPDGSDSGLFRVDGDLDITGTLKTKLSHDLIYDFDDEVNTLAQAKVDALIDSAPAALDTLNELAAALGDDASFATTVTNSIATKVGLTGNETIAGVKTFSSAVTIHTATDAILNFKSSDDSWSYMQFLQNDGDRIAYIGTDGDQDRLIINATENGANEIDINTTTLDINANVKISGTLDMEDSNITDVGDIALDTISSDAGTSINVTLGTDAGDDFIVDTDTLVVEGDNNRVGIGTTSPTEPLEVWSANSEAYHYPIVARNPYNSETNLDFGVGIKLQLDDGSENKWASIAYEADSAYGNSGDLQFYVDGYTNSTPRMTLQHEGNVGIGTTSPARRLDVTDSAIVSSQFASTSANGHIIDLIHNHATDGYNGFRFYEQTNFRLAMSHIQTGTRGYLQVGTNWEAGSEIFVVDGDNSRVGIGTASPSEMLHLQGTGDVKILLEADTDNSTETDNPEILFSQDGGAVTGSIGFTDVNDMRITNAYNHNDGDIHLQTRSTTRVTVQGDGTTKFVKPIYAYNTAFPQIRMSDDSGTDYVDTGLSGNLFYHKTSDADINFTWRDNSNNEIVTLDTGAQTLTIGEGAQQTYALKIGDNGRMNMPQRGLEFENAHGYFSPLGDMFLPLFINTSQTDLIRFQSPLTFEYYDYSASAYVDDMSNVGDLQKLLDGRRSTAHSLTNTKRKFRFVITRGSSWADDHLFYIENTWSSIGTWTSSASGGGSLTPTMQVERLDGSFDASDDSNNDWTTNSGITTDWHTTGIWDGFGLAMYYSTGMHNAETHIRITVTFPEFADASKTIGLKNIGIISSYSSAATNKEAFVQDFNRNATGYGDVNIPTGHTYKINAATVISNNGLGSGIINSSLTSVGTLTSLTSSGAVNINGSSGAMLNITNTGDTAQLKIESQGTGASGRSNIKFNTNGGDWELGARNSNGSPDNSFYIYENDDTAYRFVIEDGGNVGIGTTNPSATLDVAGDVNFTGDLTINSPESKLIFRGDDTSMNHEIESDGHLYITVDDDADDSNNFVQFRANGGGTITNLMKIQDDGNVGIGTTSPTTTLDVEGTVSYKHISVTENSDDLDVSGCTIVECTPTGSKRIGGFTGGVQGQVIHVLKVDSGGGRIFIEHNEGTGNQDIFTSSGSDVMLAIRTGITLYCTGSEWIQIG